MTWHEDEHEDVVTMRTWRMRTWRPGGLLGLMVALVASIGLALGAPHGVSVAHADDGELRQRLEAACVRIPTAEERVRTAIERLDGPADVRGSLAWIEAAIERATASGRTRIATELERRLERLTERREVLDVQLTQLERFRERCIELGVEPGAPA